MKFIEKLIIHYHRSNVRFIKKYLLGIDQHCRIWPSVVTQMAYFKMSKCKTGTADRVWEDRPYISLFVRGSNFQWFIILLVQRIAQTYMSLCESCTIAGGKAGPFSPPALQGWADVKQCFTIWLLRFIKTTIYIENSLSMFSVRDW